MPAALAFVAAALATIVPVASAHDRPFDYYEHRGTVKSVDGPGLLTLTAGSRSLPLRLAGVDVPGAATATQPAECGADESTAALQGLVAGAHRRVGYSLVRATGADPSHPGANAPVRDTDGRLIAEVATTPVGHSGSTLAQQLVVAGWARWGVPTDGIHTNIVGTLDALGAVGNTDTGESGLDDPAAWHRRGVWALCGGRLHLPSGTAPAPAVPAVWNISRAGIVQSIGAFPVVLGTQENRAPSRLRAARDAFPGGELTTGGAGFCSWLVPSAGVEFDGYGTDAPGPALDCDRTYLASARSLGSGVPTTLGGGTGDSLQTFRSIYPTAEVDRNPALAPTLDFGTPVAPGTKRSDDVVPVGLVWGLLSKRNRVIQLFSGFVAFES